MAKSTGSQTTKKQQAKIEDVMHEFKEGELESGSGKKVTKRKQAVAIALSEAGASNRQSPERNAKQKREVQREK